MNNDEEYNVDEEMMQIYEWVDSIPLSRPKKNIARDFSDGVLVAEIMKNYFPQYVETHNYIVSHSIKQKQTNWETLNRIFISKKNRENPEKNKCSVKCERNR